MGDDIITVNGTGVGSDTTLNGGSGNDVFNIRAIAGATTVNGGDGADTINVGSNAQGDLNNRGNNSGGTVGGIAALLTVNGDGQATGDSDILNVDDTGDSNASTGNLTSRG